MNEAPQDNDNPSIAIPDIGPYAWTMNALIKEICNSRPIRGFRIAGFFGSWGSGKTTLLDEVAKKINSDTENKAHLETFDAWEARDDSNLPLSILAHLIEPNYSKNWLDTIGGSKFKSIRSGVLVAFSTFTRAATGVGVSDIKADKAAAIDIVWEGSSALVLHAKQRENRERLNEVLRSAEDIILKERGLNDGGSLVVAVDNLDRCSPDKMVDVLETLHNFSGLRKISFLLVGDENAFIEGIRSRYPTLNLEGAQAYLEKIVSPVIRMPRLKDDPAGLLKILAVCRVIGCLGVVNNY